jgi:hypothetical protein
VRMKEQAPAMRVGHQRALLEKGKRAAAGEVVVRHGEPCMQVARIYCRGGTHARSAYVAEQQEIRPCVRKSCVSADGYETDGALCARVYGQCMTLPKTGADALPPRVQEHIPLASLPRRGGRRARDVPRIRGRWGGRMKRGCVRERGDGELLSGGRDPRRTERARMEHHELEMGCGVGVGVGVGVGRAL